MQVATDHIPEFTPNRVHERLVCLGEDWADAKAAAELLEENKATVLAELMADCDSKMSQGAKEVYARSHSTYREHVKEMTRARREANKARVRYDSALVWVDLMRTQSANERAALRTAP